MEIKRILSTDKEYAFAEHLLVLAFPEDERRDLKVQKEFTDNNPVFYNNIVVDNGELVGIITYWDFDDFVYIEHFAISPDKRSNGYGQKVLNAIREKLNRPIVLEVELPETDFSVRRIEFYKRQGYTLWENDYVQPPYRKEGTALPMHLMVQGNLNSETDFNRIEQKLHKNVYLVN